MKKKLLAAGLALATVFLSGCGANTGTNGNNNVSAPPKQEKSGIETIRFTDAEKGKLVNYTDTFNGVYNVSIENLNISCLFYNSKKANEAISLTIDDPTVVELIDTTLNTDFKSSLSFSYKILKEGKTTVTATSSQGVTASTELNVKLFCSFSTDYSYSYRNADFTFLSASCKHSFTENLTFSYRIKKTSDYYGGNHLSEFYFYWRVTDCNEDLLFSELDYSNKILSGDTYKGDHSFFLKKASPEQLPLNVQVIKYQ